jgi:hypothetical protein
MCDIGELYGPHEKRWIAACPRNLRESMHPFCQVVEILTITIPLEIRIEWLSRRALHQWLPDSETTDCRMRFPHLVREPAQPADSFFIRSMPAEYMMNGVDELQGELIVVGIRTTPREPEEIANRECISPQIPPLGSGDQPRPPGERVHQGLRQRGTRVEHAFIPSSRLSGKSGATIAE